jgi:hypothetical protein
MHLPSIISKQDPPWIVTLPYRRFSRRKKDAVRPGRRLQDIGTRTDSLPKRVSEIAAPWPGSPAMSI